MKSTQTFIHKHPQSFWVSVLGLPPPGIQTHTKAKLWAVSKRSALSSWVGLIPGSGCQGFPPRFWQAWPKPPLAPPQATAAHWGHLPAATPWLQSQAPLAIWESPGRRQGALCGSVLPCVLPRCCFPKQPPTGSQEGNFCSCSSAAMHSPARAWRASRLPAHGAAGMHRLGKSHPLPTVMQRGSQLILWPQREFRAAE